MSGTLIAVILWMLPAGEIWTALLRLPFWLWWAVLAVFMLGHLLAAAKWWLLALRPCGRPMRSALGPHLAGLASNLCLPGVAGGDVVRAGLAMREVDDKAVVVIGSLGDRLSDTLALLMLSSAAGLVLFGAQTFLAGSLPWLMLVVLAALGGAGLLALVLRHVKGGRVAAKIVPALRLLCRRPLALASCLAISVMVQSVFVGLNIALAQACGLDLPAAAWFFAWPLAKLIAIVPVSLAGLGVREASLAGLLAPLGADPATVVAVGLLWQSILLATGLAGGLVLILAGRSRGDASPSSIAAAGR